MLQEEEKAFELNPEGGGEFQENNGGKDTADLGDNLIWSGKGNRSGLAGAQELWEKVVGDETENTS